MESITVIGAGIGGLTFIERLRKNNPTLKITLIDKNKYHFSKNSVILSPGDISQRIDLEEWSLNLGLEFICGQINKINPRRKKIFFKELEPRDFDRLVLATGLKSKRIEVKGEHREGFFYLSEIDPIKLKDLLRISQEATVYLSTWLGVRLVFSLLNLGKEVTIIASNLEFLGDYKQRIVSLLESKKVNFYFQSQLEEAVGESMVKAVKISPLKVFSSQFLFIDSGFTANRDFFEEELTVNNRFFTNYQDLFLLGDVSSSEIETDQFFLYNQDDVKEAASSLCNFLVKKQEITFSEKISDDSSKTLAIEKTLAEFEARQSQGAKNQ